MDYKGYTDYLASFNVGDYDKVLSYFTPEKALCVLNGQKLFGTPEELRSFYGFLHSYVHEEILVDRFVADTDNVFIECCVRITGKKDMTQKDIDDSGFSNLQPIVRGQVIEMPQFIHYHLKGGLFEEVICLTSEPPRLLK